MFTIKEKENTEPLIRQLIVANTITLEAIIKLLAEKNILKPEEIFEEVKKISLAKNGTYS